jgi:hypothetical protein
VYEKERERGISKVKVEEKEGEWFETTKAVRQGCSLSLLLFTIYKEQLEKADWMKRMEMIEEKMEQREKKERKNNVIITGIGAISGNIERGWKNG